MRALRLRCAALALGAAAATGAAAADWPEWEEFAARFVEADGRVVDRSFDQRSTSEGQGYALFFALVADQRPRFDAILRWTGDKLAGGRLGERLPAWLWARREDGSWGVADDNAASDADLWLAYALLEAARLWRAPAYAATGRRLLEQVRLREVAQAGAAGPVLLPGPVGFALDGGRYRVDPSYLPGFMFRYFAAHDPRGPWQAVWDGYLRAAAELFGAGVAPDLYVVDAAGRARHDTEQPPLGSYDAIRVYLWAGMSGRDGAPLVRLLAPYAALTRRLGAPPEKVDPRTGAVVGDGYSPLGFSGAVLPLLDALGDRATLERERARLREARRQARAGAPTHYYDQVLILFGQGWLDGRFRFDARGRLQPAWTAG